MKSIYLPEPAKLNKVEKLSENETLFEIELLERKSLNHKPGQFVEVSVFGVGEAPISVSSAPTPDKPTFQLCVRAMGNVTSVLCAMQAGEKIGIRGPFGNGFEVSEFKGKDILFIAAGLGLVPLRSLIWSVLNNRKDFGKVMILNGSTSPKSLLFTDELKDWEKRQDVEFHMTVDVGDESWSGNVGVITTLIPRVEFDPDKTLAVIVGPPIMYRFAIRELKNRRMPEKNIYMSLERKMKCGVGKCGHCQMNNIYVCQDGPVFRYDQVKDIPEAI